MNAKTSSSQGFQFKQFFIAHDRCAMKVNTDGILLGALVGIQNTPRILDLGTGTGLVAIMLAQRSPQSQIIAVELEEQAYQQAQENAQQSPWAECIQVIQQDVMQLDFSQQFDLITANPPYFSDSVATRNAARDLARTAVQSHFAWLSQAKKWVSKSGKISFILPFAAGRQLMEQAPLLGLYCVECWSIYTKINQQPKRIIVTFSSKLEHCLERQLVIYDENHQYTEQFKSYTQNFYLNF